jgi:hypothetical protein
MKRLNKRSLMGLGLALPLLSVLGTAAVAAEGKQKPEIKWSEAKPIIWEYVEKMSLAKKQSTGIEFTFAEKNELVNAIMAQMEAQNLYAFVDP